MVGPGNTGYQNSFFVCTALCLFVEDLLYTLVIEILRSSDLSKRCSVLQVACCVRASLLCVLV